MSDSRKMTRRDWFRLRTQGEGGSNTAANDISATKPSVSMSQMSPIATPVNHDGLDLSKLPPMREATITSEQVTELFSDIDHLASNIQLMQRLPGSQRANLSSSKESNQLELAKASLLNNSVPRIQIRYHWQGRFWIDTLKRVSDGFHIVRIAHSTNPPSQ